MDDTRLPSNDSPLTDAEIARVLGEAGGPDAAGRGMARLRAVHRTMRDPAIEAVSEALIQRLIALESRARVGEVLDRVADAVTGAVMGAVRSIVATLAFDSRVSPALAGFRGTSGATQLAFTSEAGEIHLHITESGSAADSRVTVRGEFEAAEPRPGAVASSAAGGPIGWIELTPRAGSESEAGSRAGIRAEIDEDSMFTVRVAPGPYGVRLGLPDAEIDLGVLELP